MLFGGSMTEVVELETAAVAIAEFGAHPLLDCPEEALLEAFNMVALTKGSEAFVATTGTLAGGAEATEDRSGATLFFAACLTDIQGTKQQALMPPPSQAVQSRPTLSADAHIRGRA